MCICVHAYISSDIFLGHLLSLLKVGLHIQVYDFVGLAKLYYAGSHGMDIMGPVRPMTNDHLDCVRSTDKQVIGLDTCLSCTLILCFNRLFLLKYFFDLVSCISFLVIKG